MAIGRSANPTLRADTFAKFEGVKTDAAAMTIQGTVNKTFIMLIILLIPASYTWKLFAQGVNTIPIIIGGSIVGLIIALITVFKKTWSPVTAPIYAVAEGAFLGSLSAFFEAMFPGIVIQAVALTFGTLLALLLAYKSGLIKATENFKLGVVAATGGIFFIYFLTFIFRLFGFNMPYIHGSGTIGILFSLFVVIIAALNLVLDFDFIEQGTENKAPKYMEWYAAFGLMVTLIWLYIEFLRLLSKLRSR